MNNVKEIISKYREIAYGSFALLLPGVITSLLLFLISSNRLLPNNIDCTIFTLNLIQLYMLGITIVKYGIDQVVLSRLQEGASTELKEFFSKRVLPLTIIFSLIIAIIKGWMHGLFFLIALPIEVFIIIVSVELSINKQYSLSSIIKLMGYPFFLSMIFIADKLNHVSPRTILIIFVSIVIARGLMAYRVRRNQQRLPVAILSYQIPLQQISNFFLFRADQIIIATGLGIYFLGDTNFVGNYLFLAKFPEAAAGIIVGLGPIIYPYMSNLMDKSLTDLLKNRVFILLSFSLLITQVLISLYIFKPVETVTNYLLFLPFAVTSLLTIPVLLVIYILIRETRIALINQLNLVSAIVGLLVFGISLYINNIYVFSCIIPIQLLLFLVGYKLSSKNKNSILQ